MKQKMREVTDKKKNIFKMFNKNFKKILAIEYHYNLNDIFDCISNENDEEKEIIYEQIINQCLNTIKKISLDKIIKNNKIYDETCEFFEFSYWC